MFVLFCLLPRGSVREKKKVHLGTYDEEIIRKGGGGKDYVIGHPDYTIICKQYEVRVTGKGCQKRGGGPRLTVHDLGYK